MKYTMKLFEEYRGIFVSIYNARGIIRELILRDLRARYRQALLGYAWALITPLLIILFFTFLSTKRVIAMGEPPFSYPAYCVWNIIVWQLFSSVLLGSTNSLKEAGPLVTKVNFSKEALVLASIGQPLIDFVIKLILAAAVFIWAGVMPHINAVLVIFPVFLVLLLSLSIGFCASLLNLLFRDVSNIVGIVTTFGMFAAPVIYAPPELYPFNLVNMLNPVSPLLIACQDLIAHGEIRQGAVFCITSLLVLISFLVSIRIFHKVIPQAVERA